jgi:hypothetical protein
MTDIKLKIKIVPGANIHPNSVKTNTTFLIGANEISYLVMNIFSFSHEDTFESEFLLYIFLQCWFWD